MVSRAVSFNAAALKMMADKGLTAHDIAEIAAANERRADPTAAERKRRQRAKSRRDVTRDMVSPNESILTPSVTPVISNEITPPAENDDQPVLKPEHVVEAWNEMAARTGLPSVRKLTPKRMVSLRRRITENSIEDFTEAIDAIERSPFLRGERGDREWKANFDFLLSPEKFNRILEGTYG